MSQYLHIPSLIMQIEITSRQLEILRKAADGVAEDQIAETLKVEKQAVVVEKKNALKKIGASNPVEAIMKLAKVGFLVAD